MYPYLGDINGVTHYINDSNAPLCGAEQFVSQFVKDVYEPSCPKCNFVWQCQMEGEHLKKDTIADTRFFKQYVRVLSHDNRTGIVVVETALGETVNMLRSVLTPTKRTGKFVWVWHEYNGSHSGCYDVFWHVADGVVPDNFEDDAIGGYVTMPHGRSKQQLDSFKKALWKGMQP